MKILETLSSGRGVFIASIVLGFLLPHGAPFIEPLIIPLLIVVMTLSIKDVGIYHIKGLEKGTIAKLLLMNYGLLTTTYLLSAYFFLPAEQQPAIYLLGLMPPAVGIIAMSYILEGDIQLSFVTEMLGYLASIVILPLATGFLFGESANPIQIVNVLFLIIVVPFILSRLIHGAEKTKKEIPEDVSQSILNVCYGLTFYIVIGVNRTALVEGFWSLLPLLGILVSIRFGLSTLIYLSMRHKVKKPLQFFRNRARKPIDVLFVLFGTFKNGGAAVGFTILLFGVEATIPLAVNAVLVPLHILFLEWLVLGEKV